LEGRVAETPEAVAYQTLEEEGVWQATRWRDFKRAVASLGTGLQQLGLVAGDYVGILVPTCQEWECAHMAILRAGGVVVGLDPHDIDERINDIARHARLNAIIVKDAKALKKVSKQIRDGLKFILSLESTSQPEERPKVVSMDHMFESASTNSTYDAARARPEDPATMIFTSGTTGAPKGIVYTHEQICFAIESILEAYPDINTGSRLVCWLPLSNLFQRMVNYCAVSKGAVTYIVEDPREIMKHLPSVSPHVFVAVPRFFEKLYLGIMENISQKPAWTRAITRWAFSVGNSYATVSREGRSPPFFLRVSHALADALVLKRIRGVMGSNLQYMITGSAAMPQWLLESFHALGLLILEAYGLSENVVPVAANRVGDYKFGTVGKVLTGNEVRLSKEGELLVRGPGIFSGYYDDEPDERLLTWDGYFPTGDYAEIGREGFVTLIGRKAEVFKTSTGRRIAPVAIEGHIARLPYVEYVAVVGEGRKFLVAILAIYEAVLYRKAGSKALSLTDAYEFIQADVAREVKSLPIYQRPAGLVITSRPFTIASGELTSNLKLRRRTIEKIYEPVITELYARFDELNVSALHCIPSGDEVVIGALCGPTL
jgi:long-chain acyl-CoA synthetase